MQHYKFAPSFESCHFTTFINIISIINIQIAPVLARGKSNGNSESSTTHTQRPNSSCELPKYDGKFKPEEPHDIESYSTEIQVENVANDLRNIKLPLSKYYS